MPRHENHENKIPFKLFPTLIAVFWAWILCNIAYAVEQLFISKNAYIQDAEFFYVWTGIFGLFSAFIFIPIIIYAFNRIFKGKSRFLFPLCTALAANLFLAGFLSVMDGYGKTLETVSLLFPYTTFAGAVFGVIYAPLSSTKLFNFKERAVKSGVILVLLLSIHTTLAVALPGILRFTEENYSEEALDDKKKERVLAEIKRGDKIEEINKKYPGLFSNSPEEAYATFWIRGKRYHFAYKNGVITHVNVRKEP